VVLGLGLGLGCAALCGALAWPRALGGELDRLRAALEEVRTSGASTAGRAAEVDALLADFERAIVDGDERPVALGRLAWVAGAALAVGFALSGRVVDAGSGFVGAGLGALLARRALVRRRALAATARRDADGLVVALVPELLEVERTLPAGKRRRSRRARP